MQTLAMRGPVLASTLHIRPPGTRAVLALSVSLMLLSACAHDPTSPEQNALNVAVAQWNSARSASNSYLMEQQVACFCPYGGTTFEVSVSAGVVVSARALNTNGVEGPVQLSSFRTVDQLFDEIRAALRKSGTLIALAFDPALGFPVTVSLDPVKNAIDDEVSYQTRKVTLR